MSLTERQRNSRILRVLFLGFLVVFLAACSIDSPYKVKFSRNKTVLIAAMIEQHRVEKGQYPAELQDVSASVQTFLADTTIKGKFFNSQWTPKNIGPCEVAPGFFIHYAPDAERNHYYLAVGEHSVFRGQPKWAFEQLQEISTSGNYKKKALFFIADSMMVYSRIGEKPPQEKITPQNLGNFLWRYDFTGHQFLW